MDQSPPNPSSSDLLFGALSTAYLRNALPVLRRPIPGDPSFTAIVGNLLAGIIDGELRNPARIERDNASAKATAEAVAAAAKLELDARHKAEQDTLVSATPEQRAEAERKALADRQAAEKAALDRQAALDALAAQQAQERKDFDASQQAARAKLAEAVPQAA